MINLVRYKPKRIKKQKRAIGSGADGVAEPSEPSESSAQKPSAPEPSAPEPSAPNIPEPHYNYLKLLSAKQPPPINPDLTYRVPDLIQHNTANRNKRDIPHKTNTTNVQFPVAPRHDIIHQRLMQIIEIITKYQSNSSVIMSLNYIRYLHNIMSIFYNTILTNFVSITDNILNVSISNTNTNHLKSPHTKKEEGYVSKLMENTKIYTKNNNYLYAFESVYIALKYLLNTQNHSRTIVARGGSKRKPRENKNKRKI